MNTNTRLIIGIALTLTAGTFVGCDLGDENLGEDGGSDTGASGDGDGDGDGGVCSDAEDDPRPDTFRTVRVTNTTAAPLWIPGNDCLDFTRFDMFVDGVKAVDNPGEDGSQCSHLLQTSACAPFGCEGDGEIGGAIRLGPGESYELQWRTYAYHLVELPGSCNTKGSCDQPLSCYAGRTLEPGSQVTMILGAYTVCEDELACSCPSGETCELPQGLMTLSGDSFKAEASFEFALDDSIIEMSFAP